MNYKVVRNNGNVVAFGPNDGNYEPVLKQGDILTIEQEQPSDNSLDGRKGRLKDSLAELATAKLSAGFTINGLKISTDADARGLLSLGKLGNKPSRKIVTASGQRALLTATQFNDVVAAADNYGQAIMGRWYDLIGQIDVATEAEFDTIDITTGWPQ